MKKWSAYWYVPVLACLVAIGGIGIWNQKNNQSGLKKEQIYYLDEYFVKKIEPKQDVYIANEKNVIWESDFSYEIEKESPEFLIESTEVQSEFILFLVDGYVQVYRMEDMREMYMATGIHMDDLPEATIKEILEGKKILSEEALYFFLESYSS